MSAKPMLSTRLPDALLARVRTYCAMNRLTIQEFVELAIEEKMASVDPGGRLKGAAVTRLSDRDRLDGLEEKVGRLVDVLLGAAEKRRR